MSDHSSGPWVGSNTGTVLQATEGSFEERFVCHCHLNSGDRPQDLANMRLIAAAPELLGELTALVNGLTEIEQKRVPGRRLTDWEEERLKYAREVIAKAEGR